MIPRIFRCSSLFILVLLLCFSVLPSASAVEFQDVPKNHWAYTEIAKMTAQGILQGSGGYEAGIFIHGMPGQRIG